MADLFLILNYECDYFGMAMFTICECYIMNAEVTGVKFIIL